ncbi:MAG: radical SAM protein [Fusobacteriaceae bacterium]|nr:radical SAM protein [Fusobacteriaceae bacterium]
MRKSGKNLWIDAFSRVYVEEGAESFPLTAQILRNLPKAAVIPVGRYGELFSRKGQDFRLQKNAPQLILAVKREGFFFPGAKVCENFGRANFFYSSQILNCLYDCAYCYLQGVYDSANLVVFVNIEHTFREISTFLSRAPMYLCVSYDTDLLALDRLTGLAERWYEFAETKSNLMIELRTKCSNIGFLRRKDVNPNFVLAWTLSPERVCGLYERGSSSLKQRLAALREAVDLGYTVRICLDPLLAVPDFEKLYGELIEEIFSVVKGDELLDVSVGTFRISGEYLKRLRKNRPDCALTRYPFTLRDGVYSYPPEKSAAMLGFVRGKLLHYVRETQIYITDF